MAPTTVRLTTDRPALAWTMDRFPLSLILGNYAFKNTVLTIDYQRKVLTIRRTEYDISRRPRGPRACLLDFTPGGDAVDYAPEYLLVNGKLEEQKVPFVLDTGHVAAGMLISPPIREHLPHIPAQSTPLPGYSMQGQRVSEVTVPLHWALSEAQGESPGMVIKLRPEWQALLGYEALKRFRITIDYSRRKILLEPNETEH